MGNCDARILRKMLMFGGMKTAPVPWQLRMFQKTLKKQQRLHKLRQLIGPLEPHERCLLVTCGDNNGAMNWHLRVLGGCWNWADLEGRSIREMAELLDEPVQHVDPTRLPFEDGAFQRVVSIDVLEHITDPMTFARELRRVTAPDGQVIITVPSGDRRKLANRIKEAIGMTQDEYGHQRAGYSVKELSSIMGSVGIEPRRCVTFSRFFTELAELMINFAYVKKMSRKSKVKPNKGTIAPATKQQLQAVKKAYRLYSIVFPFVWLMSKLDAALFFTSGYVSIVEGRIPRQLS
jgi:SAM-dependent methyltransferase